MLALLPTIGALLGAPTSEIWRLLTVVPFGGVLAMTLSFGGAILPVRVEDYEDAQKDICVGLDQVVENIMARMHHAESQQLAKRHLWVGLLGMIVLFVAHTLR